MSESEYCMLYLKRFGGMKLLLLDLKTDTFSL